MKKTTLGVEKKADRWFVGFCIVLVLLLALNTFVIKIAIVDGNSMYPTLEDRDVLIVNQLGYRAAQGDIIVIHTAPSWWKREYIVKRVIAVEGQSVTIDYSSNTVCVDGEILEEPYLNYAQEDPMETWGMESKVSYTVPEGCVFVMGDNRNHSADSRSEKYGMIPQERIVGKVVFSN